MLPFLLAAAVEPFCHRHHLPVPLALDILALARPPGGNGRRPNAAFGDRPIELSAKVNGVIRFACTVAPATAFRRTFHPALDGTVIDNLDVLARGSSANAPGQINLHARDVGFGEGEA